MNTKDNQRVRLTKRIFRESLITLMQEKHLHQITVSELCEKAELNRSTFYKYYGNTYDIMAEIENEIMEQSKVCISKIDASDISAVIRPLYKLVCYIRDNVEIYRLIVHNNVSDDFLVQMIDNAFELLHDNSNIIKSDNEKYKGYIFSYLISGSITIIKEWIDMGLRESPEEIADLIYKISAQILRGNVHN